MPAGSDRLFVPAQSGRAPRALVALLHGVGGTASTILPLAKILGAGAADAAFVALDGPEPRAGVPVAEASGRQWYSTDGIDDTTRPLRIAAALPALDRRLEVELTRCGLSRTDLVLVGFSQGAAMALRAGLCRPDACRAVVAFAGRLTGLPMRGRLLPPQTLLVHGDADDMVPWAETRRVETLLRDAGWPVQAHVLPGLGHTIGPAACRLARRFVHALFTPDNPHETAFSRSGPHVNPMLKLT